MTAHALWLLAPFALFVRALLAHLSRSRPPRDARGRFVARRTATFMDRVRGMGEWAELVLLAAMAAVWLVCLPFRLAYLAIAVPLRFWVERRRARQAARVAELREQVAGEAVARQAVRWIARREHWYREHDMPRSAYVAAELRAEIEMERTNR